MPLELKQFKLPSEWGSEGDADQNSPRLYLKNSIKLDLPISGGWGYSLEDCVVIDKNDPIVNQSLPFDGTQVEYTFVEKRIYAELVVFRKIGDDFAGIKWEKSMQFLKEVDDKKYDVLNFKVTAYTQRDFEFLKNDWNQNNGYKDDSTGAEEHMKQRALRLCSYTTQYWFDITSFYGQ